MIAGRRQERGVTLPEMLVAVTIMALAVGIFAPMVGDRVSLAKGRTMAAQFAIDLRAARWVAVSTRSIVDIVVDVDAGTYEYTDTKGKKRVVRMPDGVRIVSSDNPIRFRPNGSVLGGSTTVISTFMGETEAWQWTVETSALGIPRMTHARL